VEHLAYRFTIVWRIAHAPGDILSLTVSLLNEQCIGVPQAVVRCSRGQEFAVETVMVERHTHAWLQRYAMGLVQELTEIAL
jgi:hypothetical protein